MRICEKLVAMEGDLDHRSVMLKLSNHECNLVSTFLFLSCEQHFPRRDAAE